MCGVDFDVDSVKLYSTHTDHLASIPVPLMNVLTIPIQTERMIKRIHYGSSGEDAYPATNHTSIEDIS